MSTFTQSDYDNALSQYRGFYSSFTEDCGKDLKNILFSNAATYNKEIDLGITTPEFKNSKFFDCLKSIIGKGSHETVDANDKSNIETLKHLLFDPSTTYQTMHGFYNDIFVKRAAGYYEGWFSSPLVGIAFIMLYARETRLGKYPQQQQPQQQPQQQYAQQYAQQQPEHTQQQQQQQYAQQYAQYVQQQKQQKYPQLQKLDYANPIYWTPIVHSDGRLYYHYNGTLPSGPGWGEEWRNMTPDGYSEIMVLSSGGSRRRTVHRKRKSYRKSKSKRVHHTRRKQSRRHRHSRRRHH